MGQLRSLARFRLTADRHRLTDRGWFARIVVVGVGLTIVLCAGYVLSPDTFEEMRTGSGVTHWGGWPLEAAFYLCCLLAFVQGFRILESFFRQRDARFLSTLPVRLRALFFYRLASTSIDTGVLAFGCILFFVPVWVKGSLAHFLACTALIVVSAVVVVAVGFATLMGSGAANYKRLPDVFSQMDRRSGGSAGTSAAYLFSPALALGISLAALLLAKLSIEEVFRNLPQTGHYRLSGVTRVMAGAYLLGSLGALVYAYRTFVRYFPVIFARFFESDLHVVDTGYDYFARDRKPPRGFEARLPRKIRAVYRLARLQVARRMPFGRFLAVAAPLAALALFAVYGDRLQPWMILSIGLVWTLVLSNPWSRLFHPSVNRKMGLILPVSQEERWLAQRLYLLREVVVLSVPFAVVSVVLPSSEQVLSAAVVPVLCIGLVPFLADVAERAHQAPRGLGFFVVIVAAALTQVGAVGPWLAAAALWIGAIMVVMQRLKRPTMGFNDA